MENQETQQNEKSKEVYIKPECEVIEISSEGIMCGSCPINNTSVNGFDEGREFETSAIW